jgi:peptidoglycan pentaglycine glycine transferase (the first glycine)
MGSSTLSMQVEPLGAQTNAEWDRFVAEHPNGHLLQTTGWAQLKARFGWRAVRVVARSGGRIEAGAQVLLRKYAAGTVAYTPKGPVVRFEDGDGGRQVLAGIRDLSRREGAVFAKIEPHQPQSLELVRQLAEQGYRPEARTVQPRSTIVLDVARPDEDILSGMKSKWRYNVRLAERRGVQVRAARPDEVGRFYELSCATSIRDGFPIHGRSYYETAYESFVHSGAAELLLATYEGRVLAGLMVFALGRTAWYMYGASSDEQRNLMPNHLLQWHAIRWAKARGCSEYDFWGIPDEVGRTPSLAVECSERPGGLWGVFRFKDGFGGRVVRWVGAHDLVLNPPLYWLGNTAWPLVRQAAQLMTRRRTAGEAVGE